VSVVPPLPGDSIKLGCPPFGFQVEGPDDWAVLETAPDAWRRSLDRLLSASPGWDRLPAARRRAGRGLFEDVVALAQRYGVLLTLVKFGADRSGKLFAGSLSVGWYDSTPVRADIALARLVAGWADYVEEFETPAGPAVLRCEVVEEDFPAVLAEDRRAATAQVFLPVRRTAWTAVLSAVAVGADRGELVAALARRMASTLRVTGGGTATAKADAAPADVGGVAEAPPSGGADPGGRGSSGRSRPMWEFRLPYERRTT
jgi:hypothetical protein